MTSTVKMNITKVPPVKSTHSTEDQAPVEEENWLKVAMVKVTGETLLMM